MVKGKTELGFEFEVDERIANDYRFLDVLAEAEEDPVLEPKILTAFLGKEQKERLLSFLEEDGIVPKEKVDQTMQEIFQKVGEASEAIKNS